MRNPLTAKAALAAINVVTAAAYLAAVAAGAVWAYAETAELVTGWRHIATAALAGAIAGVAADGLFGLLLGGLAVRLTAVAHPVSWSLDGAVQGLRMYAADLERREPEAMALLVAGELATADDFAAYEAAALDAHRSAKAADTAA